MPENALVGLNRDDMVNVVAYLVSQGSEVNYRRLASLRNDVKIKRRKKRSKLDYVAAEAGRKLFMGKANCVFCHRLREMPDANLRGPNLLGIGRQERAYIKKSIEDPNHYVPAPFQTYQVVLNSGQTFIGRRVYSPYENKIGLLTESAKKLKVVYIDQSEIEIDDDGMPMMKSHKLSPMAKPSQLTSEEIRLLVEFLRTVYY